MSKKYKFLVANDNNFQLTILKNIFNHNKNAETITAINGAEAVSEIQKNMNEFFKFQKSSKKRCLKMPQHFDAIILDLDMPIMDGYNAAKKILKIYECYNEKTNRLINKEENNFLFTQFLDV